MAFVAIWTGCHHFFPNQLPLEVLQVLLLTEGCCIGSVVLMNQHRQASLSQRISLNDYLVDCQIRRDVKEIHPLIQSLHKDMEEKKKNNFWCDGCGEPRYKCYCNVDCQNCGKKLVKCIGDSDTGECPVKTSNN